MYNTLTCIIIIQIMEFLSVHVHVHYLRKILHKVSTSHTNENERHETCSSCSSSSSSFSSSFLSLSFFLLLSLVVVCYPNKQQYINTSNAQMQLNNKCTFTILHTCTSCISLHVNENIQQEILAIDYMYTVNFGISLIQNTCIHCHTCISRNHYNM